MYVTIEYQPQCDCPRGDEILITPYHSGRGVEMGLWCPTCKTFWKTHLVYHRGDYTSAKTEEKP